MTNLTKSILKVREIAANLKSNPIVKAQLGEFITAQDEMLRDLDADMKAADKTDGELSERLKVCEDAMRKMKFIS